MTLIDTPDWQHNSSSAGVFLAQFSNSPVAAHNVTLPTNAESIVILSGGSYPNAPTVQGDVSSLFYEAIPIAFVSAVPSAWAYKVVPNLDPIVIITPSSGPANEFYVISDQGVLTPALAGLLNNVVAGPGTAISNMLGELVGLSDGSHFRYLLGNNQGIPYAIPSAPGPSPGQHPPNELTWINGEISATTIVIATPGAGKRIRIFFVKGWYVGAANTIEFTGTTSTGDVMILGTLSGTALGNVDTFEPPLNGQAFANNEGFEIVFDAAGGDVFYNIGYTTETI